VPDLENKAATRRDTLWEVSVGIALEAEEATIEALANIFDQPASIYADIETGSVMASTYLPRVTPVQRRALRDALARMSKAGLNVGPGRIRVRRIPRENWAESWKRHFRPLEVSSRLLVVPSWSKRRPRPGQVAVILDPGLSFGTGHHPTTGFCLRQIAGLRTDSHSQSFLDIGTGSGILAIAAIKLGYSPVEAFDFDPDAVRVARGNAGANAVRLNVTVRDLTTEPLRPARLFDVVCANLIYDLLVEQRRRIRNRVARGGSLVLAGILKKQFPAVRTAFEEVGMTVGDQWAAGEWHSAVFH
jgi:ribosomal protein L11 methyltransferase